MPNPGIANCAVDFRPEAFSTSKRRVLGWMSAGKGFLGGFLRHSGVDRLFCFTDRVDHFAQFAEMAGSAAVGERPIRWISHANIEELQEAGCLYHPAPLLGELAWQRRLIGQRRYSICGVNHTLCSSGILEAIGALLIAPVQRWDALICTSRASKAAIEHILQRYADYLGVRLKAEPEASIELPVIPLGVDCDAYDAPDAHEEARRRVREKLRIKREDIVVLYVGRLTYHAKAHPLPMFLALEAAARRTGTKLHLILAGWYPSRQYQAEFEEAARQCSPSVVMHLLDGRGAELPAAWHAGDIFISLPDNIQETFGLTPIEAMAAGLPQVVSDWDGYRDTVRHGIDGFCVDTTMPPPGVGEVFARRYYCNHDPYHIYTGRAAQATALDVAQVAEALAALIEQPELRRRMGQAGRQRARQCFDWSIVIRTYQELWQELARRREHAEELAPPTTAAPPHPLHEDPFAVFATYATQTISPELVVRASPGHDECYLNQLRQLPMMNFSADFLLDQQQSAKLVEQVRRQPQRVADLLELCPEAEHDRLLRTLGWLMKADVLRIEMPLAAVSAPDETLVANR